WGESNAGGGNGISAALSCVWRHTMSSTKKTATKKTAAPKAESGPGQADKFGDDGAEYSAGGYGRLPDGRRFKVEQVAADGPRDLVQYFDGRPVVYLAVTVI